MTTLNLNNINDDLIEINRDTFNNKQMSFNIPTKQQRANQNNFMSDDVLFNKLAFDAKLELNDAVKPTTSI